MSIEIKLEVFEGPFELLYHLIEKAKIDIYDIPIAEVTEQYIAYIDTMKSLNIDLASEFLIMAATLLEIKSKLLLPKTSEEEEEQEDPREELVMKLLEYRKFKEISLLLKERFLANAKSFYRDTYLADSIIDSYDLPDELPISLIVDKYENILLRNLDKKAPEYRKVFRDSITVDEKIHEVLRILSSTDISYFDELLIYCDNKQETILTFLAILELIKRRSIYVEQKSNFNKILIKKVHPKIS